SELQQNLLFSWVWAVASNEWQDSGVPVSPVSSDQAIALKAYTIIATDGKFDPAVCEAGSSRQEYRDKFHYKTLHFLLTQALATLRVSQGQQCHDVSRVVRGVWFQARRGDIIRFGQFVLTSLSETSQCSGTDTVFQVKTCHGADIDKLSFNSGGEEVLIPPFETFEVTNVTWDEKCPRIQLSSTGTHSNYNCEWLRGDVTEG
ncbi:NARE ribosyltransferase, partial [Vireo altiloquus]|nr:NARE ribosyltransferase [Vireo altiloquus]